MIRIAAALAFAIVMLVVGAAAHVALIAAVVRALYRAGWLP